MQKYLKQILMVFTLLTLANCASGVGHNIKLKEFPEAKDVSGLNMYRYAFDHDAIQKRDAKKNGFKPLIWTEVEKFQYPTPEQIKSQKQALLPKSGCVLDVEYSGKGSIVDNPNFGIPYNIVSGLTLFLIPYYQPSTHTITGKLIDAKTGNIIKEYSFNEKTRYIVINPISLILFVPIMGSYEGADSPAQASFNAQIKLNNALIRTVTNDAFNFPECKK